MATVNFRTNVLLKSIIGKDLITDDNNAVLELVKNSFDAGSNKVVLEFENLIHNLPNKDSKLIISDTGIGMSEYDLENKWLNIAYSEKKERREEYGRILAGNKGVGRFSCDRLGQYLTIYSRKQNENFTKLYIDWNWFEVTGNIDLNIQDINLETEEIKEEDFFNLTGIQTFTKGTILEISSLRETWSYNKILSLKRQLERLINPNQSFKSLPFEVEIIAKDYFNEEKSKENHDKINGIVKNRIFENLDFRTTSIQSNICACGDLTTTTLQDRGNNIFKLVERNKFTQLKNIDINIYYLNPYSKAYFTKQTGIRSVNFGSIFLFINGFRIPPYGDEGDDWLGMENRKGQGYSRYLGTREVVGRIEIKDEDENFKIISNRTGVVNNEAFFQLTKNESPFGYYYKTFRRLERFVAEGIKWDSTNEDERKLETKILNDPNWDESKENYLEDSLTRNKRVIQVVRNIIDAKKDDIISLSVNESFVDDLIEEQSNKVKLELDQIAERLTSQNLSTKEIASFLEKINISKSELDRFSSIISPYKKDVGEIENIYNDLESRYNQLKQEKSRLEKKLEEEEKTRKEVEEKKQKIEADLEVEKQKNTYLLATRRTISPDADGLIHNIKLNTSNIISYVNIASRLINAGNVDTNKLLDYLSNIAAEAEKCLTISKIITRADIQEEVHNKPINIPRYIEQYCEHYNDVFDRSVELKVDNKAKDYWVITNILDLSLVFDNLFSNAQKWNASEILLEINNTSEDTLSIIVNDNGIGLVEKYANNSEKIFELGINEQSPNNLGYGGSGIGLFTVRKTLKDVNKNLKGDIRFIGNGYKLKGASFEITLKNKYINAELPNH